MGPSRRNRLPNLASQMRVAFSNIALKTGSSSPGELEMTFNTSDVAVCCSSASSRSRVRRATFVSLSGAKERRPRPDFGALRRVNVLRRCALTALPPLRYRLIVPPRLGQEDRSNSYVHFGRGGNNVKGCPLWVISGHMRRKTACPLYPRKRHKIATYGNVRFGPAADMPIYSIISFARACSAGGTLRPSALAVLRLITSSNLTGVWTGS